MKATTTLLVCSILASGLSVPSAAAKDSDDHLRGKTPDYSRTLTHGVAPNTESPNAASDESAPFRITVDGVPLDGSGERAPDAQRKTDVALEKANIQIKFDPLQVKPALNVWAYPNEVARGAKVEFLFETSPSLVPKEHEDGSIDYRSLIVQRCLDRSGRDKFQVSVVQVVPGDSDRSQF